MDPITEMGVAHAVGPGLNEMNGAGECFSRFFYNKTHVIFFSQIIYYGYPILSLMTLIFFV